MMAAAASMGIAISPMFAHLCGTSVNLGLHAVVRTVNPHRVHTDCGPTS
jgi:hypothetical protein